MGFGLKIGGRMRLWTLATGAVVVAFGLGLMIRSDPGKAAPEPMAPVGMVWVPAGEFRMGLDSGGEEDERPAHPVRVDGFWMDRYEVTVAEFGKFVEATGHRTRAERHGTSNVLRVGAGWNMTPGANWKFPEGPDQPPARYDEPVSQVSWEDATAYAAWTGKRLPTEAEWEWAARGGMTTATLPWGNDLTPGGRHHANLWQGVFPDENQAQDGFQYRAPVGTFPASGYGIHDLSGNVWEWASDYYDSQYYQSQPKDQAVLNPQGPTEGKLLGDTDLTSTTAKRSTRGGSFACSPQRCEGYRVTARTAHPEITGLNNLGFRCVRSTPGSPSRFSPLTMRLSHSPGDDSASSSMRP
jgi:sulfatase modifying factor 1